MINEFIEWAEKNNWNIITDTEIKALPDSIKNRYDIPVQWYDLICRFRVCEDQTATKWFLTPDDYLPRDEGFQWNEFELQSLEYCDDEDSITEYWDKHLPVFMSVDGEYSYIAINTENGNVVIGYEPEYEESTVLTDDFESFISEVISGEILL